MFVHSVPVPRLYKAAARSLATAQASSSGSLSHHLYQESQQGRSHPNKNGIFALVAEAIKHESHLDDFFTRIDLFNAEPRLDQWLARILFTELIWGKQTLPGESKPVQTVLRYYENHKDSLKNVSKNCQSKKVVKPRYVRVNTLRLSAADAVRSFQDDGWNLVRCTSGSYNDYLKQLENLGEFDFIPDYHIKVVFAFHPKTIFQDSEAYMNSEIFLQDKATCLAGHLLAPTPGSVILDMCAAPGMKTTHLAALIKNEGTIYSIERDKERFDVLSQFVEASGATCVKLINKDVTELTKNDCPNVDYVLLDPSCSGSGINRFESNNPERDFESGRLKKLSSFQAKLLRHALNEFRTAKRIVYSTCSIYPQENEEVVNDVLRNHKGNFRLVSAKEKLNNQWNNTGDCKYVDIGEKCIYAITQTDYTSGFFVAVFEQFERNDAKESFKESCDSKDYQVAENDTVNERKAKKHKKVSKEVISSKDSTESDLSVENSDNKKSKKKRTNVKNVADISTTHECVENIESVENETRKEKKKKKKREISEDSQDCSEVSVIKHKKKNKNKKTELEESPKLDETPNNVDGNEIDNTTDHKTKKRKAKDVIVTNFENEKNMDNGCNIEISKKSKKKKKSIDS